MQGHRGQVGRRGQVGHQSGRIRAVCGHWCGGPEQDVLHHDELALGAVLLKEEVAEAVSDLEETSETDLEIASEEEETAMRETSPEVETDLEETSEEVETDLRETSEETAFQTDADDGNQPEIFQCYKYDVATVYTCRTVMPLADDQQFYWS